MMVTGARCKDPANQNEELTMTVLRTPDTRFVDLEGYDFAPRYTDIADAALGTLRVHYLDEGPRDGPCILMMHGEPSWSYLYRKMIPPLVAAGARVLAPDLVGFGRSDKPAAVSDYTYQRHVDWMTAWLNAVGPHDVTLFCQDWGGLIGLRLVAADPDRFRAVVASNTFLPTGDRAPSEAFMAWKKFSQEVPVFPAGNIVLGATARGISDAARAAYDAPFPDESFKAGARAFPLIVPLTADDAGVAENLAAWKILETWEKPFLTLFGDSDPITAGVDKVMQQRIPGTRGLPHRIIENAGHFIQEDAGETLAAEIAGLLRLG